MNNTLSLNYCTTNSFPISYKKRIFFLHIGMLRLLEIYCWNHPCITMNAELCFQVRNNVYMALKCKHFRSIYISAPKLPTLHNTWLKIRKYSHFHHIVILLMIQVCFYLVKAWLIKDWLLYSLCLWWYSE